MSLPPPHFVNYTNYINTKVQPISYLRKMKLISKLLAKKSVTHSTPIELHLRIVIPFNIKCENEGRA